MAKEEKQDKKKLTAEEHQVKRAKERGKTVNADS